ncbi:semaphorin-3F isoform X3 [Physeter macrocephalus]|uniref:Semaphorin-3F isoform X3 n=1 Tax=Physeter macrocephalus TaxID=9755 RepID=A0A2Y9F4H9_PHYMC|nr:semaphorin-3F isoform X3 [Physeter catodon]|eukprot:XP_007114008.1 semaphorin-3F isoform X2 [Physeter catodon]
MPVAGLLLWASLLTGAWPATPTQDYLPATPRVRLSFKELKATGTAHFFNFLLNTTDYRILLKDEDHDRMYVGSKDYVLSLDLHDINREPLIIHWAASPQRIEECVLSGKDGNGECGNFVRLIQPWNRTHLYVCGTGAYNPMCTYVNRGRRAQDYIFYLEPEKLESGKGKCPYDPKLDTASALINEELYAGVYIDFMGTDAAIFRTLGKQTAMRTDQYNSRWLNDPSFIHAELIPDSAERNDDKLYFFFRERSAEAPQSPAVYARIGRICLNDDGGHCCLVNKWSTFLKARLVCSVPGEDGIETHFDELQDVFVQQTQDVRNPVIYAVFTSSGSVFRGSAVCVYSMADIRMVFNGPFAHKEGPNYQWMPFSGKMPYPRPGTCPGGTFTPSMKSTKDYPDEVINFMRTHPLMYQAVYPLQRRPLVVRTGSPYRLTTVAVDQVDAADGRYEVLFLGTDRGTVQKVIVLPKDDQEMEELMLEEVEVFKDPAPVKTMTISSKRQQLYVASAVGVTHLSLHRCQAYGAACADCCLARDPYCAWDGQACSRYTASSKRRSRRQDVRHGNPIRQCRGFNSNANKNAVESVQYGVAGSAAFLECQPRSPQATVKWLFQRDPSDRRREMRADDRFLRTEQGLLLRALQLGDRGLYSCTATENNFKHVITRVQLHVLGQDAVHAALFPPPAVSVPPPPGARPPTPPYQELAQLLAQPEVGLIHQYCQGYWRHVPPSHREAPGAPRPPEPQDQKKPRNRRHHPPDT